MNANRQQIPDTSPSIKRFEVDGVPFNIVLVKGGTFWMGSQKTKPREKNYDQMINGQMLIIQAMFPFFQGLRPTGWSVVVPYDYPPVHCRVSCRFGVDPKKNFNHIGLRLALSK